MIYQLYQADYDQVRPLFQPLAEYLPFCAAVLRGRQAGRVFVDDTVRPRAAFMITREMWCYLAGDPHNQAFNDSLRKAILTREIVGEDVGGLLVGCYPEEWRAGLATVFDPRSPIAIPRRRYLCRELNYDWRANVPAGFAIQWADARLLEHRETEVPEDVSRVLELRGPDGDPLREGFGFVVLHSEQIVAHAVIDCIVDGVGDIGLVTAEGYRRRGLATVTAAATVEYGLSHGLALLNWDCSAANIGSLRTAERLGFEHERDHTLYLSVFDETGHRINLAWNSLESGHYQEAIDACQQIIARQGDAPAYAYFPAACAWAALGDRDKALEYLNAALEKGWDSWHETTSREELEFLHDTPQWPTVLDRIQRNRQRT